MILSAIKILIISEAMRQGFDPGIALSVAAVESRFNPAAIGAYGEIGLFQILPRFSQVSVPKLLNPRENAREGIRQLKYWKKHCPIDLEYLACYNGGMRNKKNLTYVNKIKAIRND